MSITLQLIKAVAFLLLNLVQIATLVRSSMYTVRRARYA